jgi:hypothetical protein
MVTTAFTGHAEFGRFCIAADLFSRPKVVQQPATKFRKRLESDEMSPRQKGQRCTN